MSLKIANVDPVLLEGYLDSSQSLQFRYEDEELAEHDHQIDLVGVPVRVIIQLPSAVEDPKVSHEGERDTVVWAQTSTGFEHEFRSAVTDPVETRTDSSSGHEGVVHVKVTPKGGLPDPTP